MTARAQLAAIRAQLDALEASLADGDDVLLELSEAAAVAKTTESTLRRWATEGRLACVELERRKLACWKSALVKAINAKPYDPALRAVEDPFEAELAAGTLRRAR